jgi:hypothetical protein
MSFSRTSGVYNSFYQPIYVPFLVPGSCMTDEHINYQFSSESFSNKHLRYCSAQKYEYNLLTSYINLFYFCRLAGSSPVRKTEITVVGIGRADHATPFYPQKLALNSQTSYGCLVGTVRSPTKATEFYYYYYYYGLWAVTFCT